jgi:hypothetical protein
MIYVWRGTGVFRAWEYHVLQTVDSDDDESELEELDTVESVRETEMSDNIL